ncbi:MAG TPA: LytTR family DNA-binding domain-containing protein [Bacteroidales bacterium]|nr:LytTR family DNA-binding domain-containing protein [Bacteroidales bacterium]
MNSGTNRLTSLFNGKLKLFLSISTGIFLLILFFQPFPLDRFDLNNSLIFVAGFSGIVFLLLVLVWLILPWRKPGPVTGNKTSVSVYINGILFTVLASVASVFYLRYVGDVPMTFYIIFKIVIICLAVPAAARLYETNRELKQQVESLLSYKKTIEEQIERYEDDILNKTIEFNSENNTEILTLLVSEIAFIKSADNYVEIVYRQDGAFKRNLIRNTLKNIELQLKDYANFVRCHRICIVNRLFVEKLSRGLNNHWLTIKGYKEQIPVSRQYLLKLKEVI